MIGPVRRLLPLAAAALLLAGCGAGAPPEVVFTAGAAAAAARPTQYCEDDFVTCTNDATAPVELSVPPGTALRVDVPGEVADTPWQVVFTYRTAAGEQVDERTAVQVDSPGFTLELPEGARLLTAQVQQYGPPPVIDETTGELQFPIRSSWVLTAGAA
jgi:hypothetical protein